MEVLTWFLELDKNQVALGALVTFGIVSIIRGWMIPRSVHNDRITDKNEQILALAKERDDWKSAFMKSEDSRTALLEQNGDLIDGAETTNRLMESMRSQMERLNPQRQIES